MPPVVALHFLRGSVKLLVRRSLRWGTVERSGTSDLCDLIGDDPRTIRAMVESDPGLVPSLLGVWPRGVIVQPISRS